ncbi:hypothetical protein COW09_01510 [bacterium (Candidatus Moisslbacteria) CG12_big_fil_rev_8_21_14_0_65_36_11]|nr:type II/IV secretion system protein [Candidatus Kuenenbacteria bacterium]PIV46172.1 MAG: hypothetical protein COS23_00510 [bacterium (Candidatus Moisslbacteria) CG02_land_8_20_14_3_00_36_53]PIW67814.1 MAG: hypothetical protein COW09_01510 [bacterium (Candidatus Moisslbacteria) CG12_big_fil_rev_8_21_14_0_65_36_11]PIZ90384.1 MAG: hypothetical protein COX87_00755 [bacterium (Candidatus Moisslbacteria) CG_4_10_14_0_2_um_filter_36_61]PJC00747.1 MAG: hypothetical protein CO074_00965 [bacterium (Ca
MSSIDPQKSYVSEGKKQEELKEKLEEIRIKKEEEKIEALAREKGFSYVDLAKFPIAPEALQLISLFDSQRFGLICFFVTEASAKIASTEPDSPEIKKFIKEEIEDKYNLKTELFFISEHSFLAASRLYATLPRETKIRKGVEITPEDLKRFEEIVETFKDLNQEIQRVSISDLLALVLASALKARASDVHIEAEEKDVKIRFRVDGLLIDVAELAKSLWPQVITRIKLISGLKINITTKPQDGSFVILLPTDRIDVRVSSLPTAYGESVVMRILRSSAQGLDLEGLGLRRSDLDLLKKQAERPNGLMITVGPTGSGKTTTLYAILSKLNDPETKIITIEDPIEYRLKGVNQSQIDPTKNYTFANGLRSIMRQDPDVILVGEIRDAETAEISIQAALTGHLVLSTLHTNDSFGAIPRFLSLGVKPYLLAPALNMIMGQRLVRRVCSACKTKINLDDNLLKRVKEVLGDKLPKGSLEFYQGKGCRECQGLGYKGRVGIYEILNITPELEKMIASGEEVSEYKIKEVAIQQGMTTMVQDGLLKALEGMTTVDEVFRVTE